MNALEAGVSKYSGLSTEATQLYVTVRYQGAATYAYASGPTGVNTLSSMTKAGVTTTFTYDANGNLASRFGASKTCYEWNPENLVTKVRSVSLACTEVGSQIQAYDYDGLSRRVKVEGTSSSTWTVSIFSGMDAIFEKDNAGAVTKYVYANGMRIAKITSAGVQYYLGDHLGSTRKILDASRSTVFSTEYEPFGKPYAVSGTEAYKFTSEKHDDPTGLVYLRARQYDPDVGRFVGADPVLGSLSRPQTLNRYAYVTNNPMTNADPSGMSGCNAAAGDQLYAACERWESWHAFTAAVDAWQTANPNPMDFWTGMDLLMAGIGFIPVVGDIASTVYFLGRDVQECLASGCNWANIGLDALGFLPLLPALGAAVHVARTANRADDLADFSRFAGRTVGHFEGKQVILAAGDVKHIIKGGHVGETIQRLGLRNVDELIDSLLDVLRTGRRVSPGSELPVRTFAIESSHHRGLWVVLDPKAGYYRLTTFYAW